MNHNIRTYDDLIRTQLQMEVLLQAQKELVIADLKELKEQFQPASAALGLIGKFTSRDKGNVLITGGLNSLIDLVVKRVVLAKAGWLTKFLVPILLKNYSSHFVAEHKDEFLKKIFSWISPKNGNGKATPATTTTTGEEDEVQ